MMCPLIKELIQLIENDPEGWSFMARPFDSDQLRHKSELVINNVQCWIGLNLSHPHKSAFGLREKWALRQAIKKWKNRSFVLAKLQNGGAL